MEEEDLQFPERASASLPTSETLGLEVLTPQMATADMPEAWGGRPRGTTRRAIRMQKAWDDERKIAMEEQESARKQYEFNRASEILARKQYMDESRYDREMEEYSAKQKLDAQKEFERQGFTSALNQLDPNSDKFNEQLAENYRLYPLAALIPEVKATVDEYKLANQAYRESKKAGEQESKAEEAFRVQQEATAAQLGIDTSEFVDPNTGEYDRIGLMRRIGEEQAASGIKSQISDILDKKSEQEAMLKSETKQSNKKAISDNIAKFEEQLTRRNNELFDVDPKLKNLPRPENEEEFAEIEVGAKFVTKDKDGRFVVLTKKDAVQPKPTSPQPSGQPQVDTPTATQPTPQPTATPQKTIEEAQAVLESDSADFLEKARAEADIAAAKKQIETEKRSGARVREAEGRKQEQAQSAVEVAELQDELNSYYDLFFEAGQFNPATGMPTKVKEGISAENIKKGLEKIREARIKLGEDPRNIDPELEQIYINATR